MISVNPLLVLSGLGLSTACFFGYSLGPVGSLGDLMLLSGSPFFGLCVIWLAAASM
jgi:hypothetical protein